MQIRREKGSHCFTFDRPNTLPDHLSRCSIACLGDVIATAQHYPNCSKQAKANKHTSLELSVQRISAQAKGRHYNGASQLFIYTQCLNAVQHAYMLFTKCQHSFAHTGVIRTQHPREMYCSAAHMHTVQLQVDHHTYVQ